MPQKLIELKFEEYKKNNYLTHGIHPYPAKYVPQIPKEVIANLSKDGDWVLDPFCGSGTSLLEAKLANRNAMGIDVNPLAALISRVKTANLTSSDVKEIKAIAELFGGGVRVDKKIALPVFQGIEKWFDLECQRELAQIKSAIDKVRSTRSRQFLSVVFSSIIVRVSNQENDTRYKAIDKGFEPGDAFDAFSVKIIESLKKALELNKLSLSAKIEVVEESAEKARLPAKEFRLVVTSPPYMNSYDYYLYHKHRMNWLGLNYRPVQDAEIGSRNKHNDQGLGVEVYTDSIKAVFANIKPALKKGGHVAIVVGDGIWQGNLYKMDGLYDKMFSSLGFKKSQQINFPQRKYTRSFTPNLRGHAKAAEKDSYLLVYTL